jgi:hypothetical protein
LLELTVLELTVLELSLLELSLAEPSFAERSLSEPCPADFSRERSRLESLELEAWVELDSPEPLSPPRCSPADFAESPSLSLPFVELESEEWLRFVDPPLRSFFAQPEPLKWIVGGLKDLRSVPTAAQAGHAAGGPPLIEWTISLVRPQFEQM